jgi:hypothetical protein
MPTTILGVQLLAHNLERDAYYMIRRARPNIPACEVWAYVNSGDQYLSIEQYVCRHQWSHGYDDSDHEIPIYCNLCGAPGDI